MLFFFYRNRHTFRYRFEIINVVHKLRRNKWGWSEIKKEIRKKRGLLTLRFSRMTVIVVENQTKPRRDSRRVTKGFKWTKYGLIPYRFSSRKYICTFISIISRTSWSKITIFSLEFLSHRSHLKRRFLFFKRPSKRRKNVKNWKFLNGMHEISYCPWLVRRYYWLSIAWTAYT